MDHLQWSRAIPPIKSITDQSGLAACPDESCSTKWAGASAAALEWCLAARAGIRRRLHASDGSRYYHRRTCGTRPQKGGSMRRERLSAKTMVKRLSLEDRLTSHAARNDANQCPARRHDSEMPHPRHYLCMGRKIRRHSAHIDPTRAACTRQFALCRLGGTLRAGYSDPAAFFFEIQSSSNDRAPPKYLFCSTYQTRRSDSVEGQVRNDAHLCTASSIQRSRSGDDRALADLSQCRFHFGRRQLAYRYRPSLSRRADRRVAQLLYDRRGGHSRAAQAPRCRDLNTDHIAPGACPAHPAASPHRHPGQDHQPDVLSHALRGPILLVRRRRHLDWLSD